MTRWRVWIGVAIAVVALLLYGQWERRRASEEIGKWREIGRRLQRDSAALAGRTAKTDTQFVRDTIRLTRSLTRYVDRRDTVLARLTDTVLVREFVAAADSTVAACRAVVATCEQRVAQRDSLLSLAGQQRTADQRLFRAQLARANPRVVPYVEALVDPIDSRTVAARGGLELRLFGGVRAVGAGQYMTTGDHRFRALIGARVTF